MDRHVWQAEHYRRANSRQFRTAVEALELAGLTGGRLADIGCGSGEITRAMAERGYTVAASDFSPSMVEATREHCQGFPVTVQVQDARELRLDGTFDIVHCSWVLHWLDDIDHALTEMARAVAPGGALVLQWSRGNPRSCEGDAVTVLHAVMNRPRWRDRLADTPFAMHQHPADEVAARLLAAGLTLELPPTEIDAQFVADPVALGRIMASAGLAAQADKLGDDAGDFVTEVATEMIAANTLNPHNTRLIARAAASRAG
ncbi:class I SAM-dependent methyltransferase [Kutzneria sp. NPDC052558]|uniref:class I SAM-dependent methyltransferase n=1 Tax=Kutzneria sp. NPDC052558 TaxID=3364121 RepID=UPI0037C94C43